MKRYSLWLHGKQGDELCSFLKFAQGNVAQALTEWADSMRENAQSLDRLASILDGKEVSVQASGSFIFFIGDEAALSAAEGTDLISEEEYFDDGDDFTDGECDCEECDCECCDSDCICECDKQEE